MFKRFINQLLLNHVFNFEKDKVLMLNKVPFVMFPARAMAKFVQKLGDEFDSEELYQMGYDAGLIVGEEFVEKLNWFQMGVAKKMNMIFKMFEIMGFGKIDIKVWDTKNYRLLYRKTNHPVIDHAIKLFGKNQKICNFYMGIEAAHWHNEMGIKNCKLIETQCISKGSKFCEFSYNYFKKFS
jgi:predicted hydrocarbon binding protein